MNKPEQIEMLIEHTINGAIATIASYFEEIKKNKEILKISEPQEFVFGLIIGMALGIEGAAFTAIKQEMSTPEEQTKIRDLLYNKIPQIREEIFR